MRIALAQINPIIGDIAGNSRLIREAILQSRGQGAALVVFPELTITGYPPRDLLLKPHVIQRCHEELMRIAEACTGIAAVVGYPQLCDRPSGRGLYNAAAVCRDGKVVHRHDKNLLPHYDVFDETRYFEPGRDAVPIQIGHLAVGVNICEDLWNQDQLVERQLYHHNPIDVLAEAGTECLINCSASPFVAGKHQHRLDLFRHVAKRHRLPVCFVNQVGGNDELIFDGNSCVIGPDAEVIAHAKDFESDLLLVDWPVADPADVDRRSDCPPSVSPSSPLKARIETPKTGVQAVYHALVLGLRDYGCKCGFGSVVVGLSGGIDSAVTAALCVAAFGSRNVRGVAMPSRYSSEDSVADARDLADRLGIRFDVIPIAAAHEALEQTLLPHFNDMEPDATEENVQARIRGIILMALSNKFGSLLVSTGNKSELAVGYCTLYGDMAGGLAVLSDVPKTLVWELARWINDGPDSPLRAELGGQAIPLQSINKPPSAELRPNQTDQDSLPPYDLLDQIIDRYVVREQPVGQIVADLPQIDPDVVAQVVRLIDRNEYKRRQAAPGLKVTGRAFGSGRRMPIAQRLEPDAPARPAGLEG